MKEVLKPVAPVRRQLIDTPDADGKPTGPRRGDFVYDIPVRDELENMMKKDISNKKLRLAARDVNAANSKIEQIKKKTEMKARAQLDLFKKEMVQNDIK